MNLRIVDFFNSEPIEIEFDGWTIPRDNLEMREEIFNIFYSEFFKPRIGHGVNKKTGETYWYVLVEDLRVHRKILNELYDRLGLIVDEILIFPKINFEYWPDGEKHDKDTILIGLKKKNK